MTDLSETKTLKDIIEALSSKFARRASFLEEVLRTGLVRVSSGDDEPLDQILKRDDWRAVLLAALGKCPAKSKGKFYQGDRRSRRSASQGAPQRGTEDDPPAYRVTDEIDRFVRQHVVYYFVQYALGEELTSELKEPSEEAPPMTVPAIGDIWDSRRKGVIDRCVERWRTWILGELLSFADATIIEILADLPLGGRASVNAYDDSLAAARQVHFVTEKRWKDGYFTGLVPARVNLEKFLISAAPAERTGILWHFIQDWKSTANAILSLDGLEEPIATWIINLITPQESRPGGSEPKSLRAFASALPTGRQSWLFDPARVMSIVRAATNIDSPDQDRSAGPEDARILEEAREDFLQSCMKFSRREKASSPRAQVSGKDDEVPLSADERTQLSRLEDIWWTSFVKPPTSPDGRNARPLKIASFCYGAQVARWKIAASGVKRAERIASFVNFPGACVPGTVTIFGAGVAGLTAAHELAERGFEVTVVEAAPPTFQEEETVQVGGLARSQWSARQDKSKKPLVPLTTIPPSTSKEVFPGEHGYRLFPGFYRHVFDTMKRTPLVSPGNGTYPTALDQLQPTFQQVFAQRTSAVPLSRSRPRSLEAFRREYMNLTEGLGFERRDLARFFFKLVRYLTTCSQRRAAQYEDMTFMEFLGGESHYSTTFLEQIKAAPQALVAMDATVCDARTQGNVYLQLLMDQILGGEYTDSTLRGPTSTAWFIPWRDYLKKLKVRFVNAKLLSIRHDKNAGPPIAPQGCGDGGLEVILELSPTLPEAPTPSATPLPDDEDEEPTESALIERVKHAEFYVMALDPVEAEQATSGWDSTGVPSELRGFTSYLDVELTGRLDRYDVSVPFPAPVHRQRAEERLRRLLRRIRHEQESPSGPPVIRSTLRSLTRATGELLPAKGESVEEFRVSLWFQRKIGPEEIRRIEQTLALWVPEDQEVRLTSSAPEWLKGPTRIRTPRLPDQVYGEDPRDRFQTFTGIQYYFKHDFKLVRGHVYFPDTDWGLSAISQSQFWWHAQSSLPKDILGILSVDIGACKNPSSFTGKALVESSPDQIAEEVWRQIKNSLRTTRGVTSLVTSLPLPEPVHYHLDQNLVMSATGLKSNRTPFLINNAGDWARRPRCMPWVPGQSKFVSVAPSDGTDVWQAPYGGYRVHRDQVVFCGQYMRTFTRMNTMEAANESARHAVNAILDYLAYVKKEEPRGVSGGKSIVSGDYCQIWDIEQNELPELDFFKRVDEMLFKAGKPHMADILQFDSIADLQHPTPTSGQALATALGVTATKDWGVQPGEVVSGLNGLMEVARKLGKELGGAHGGEGSPMTALLSLLTGGKGGAPVKP